MCLSVVLVLLLMHPCSVCKRPLFVVRPASLCFACPVFMGGAFSALHDMGS